MLHDFLQKIVSSKIIQFPVVLSKRTVILGFDGLSLYEVLRFFIRGIQKNSLTTRASSLAFKFFLALFPFIIFLFALIPYIPIDNFQEELLILIKSLLPTNAYELTGTVIDELITNENGSLLSFGFIFALYLASNGINSMIIAFNDNYHVLKKSSFFESRLRSFLLLTIITALMITAISLIVFSGIFTKYLIAHNYISGGYSIYVLKVVKFIVLLLIFFLGISSIYYYGNYRNKKFRFVSAGSTLATLLSILLSSGFAYYVNNFSSYNKIYGSIGTLMVIMIWLYFNSLVLLIGFELNASISHAKEDKLNNQKS